MPDRLTDENLRFVVSEHSRRLAEIEKRTEDLNLIRADVARVVSHVHDIRGDVQGIRMEMRMFASHEDVDGLRKALYTFALTVAGSALAAMITLIAIFK